MTTYYRCANSLATLCVEEPKIHAEAGEMKTLRNAEENELGFQISKLVRSCLQEPHSAKNSF